MSSLDTQIRFECECGATLRAPISAAGKSGKCKTCGRLASIPFLAKAEVYASAQTNPKSTTAAPVNDSGRWPPGSVRATTAAPVSAKNDTCSICQSLIATEYATTACADCGLPFHLECWEENLGCSAYGCSQVNALRTGPDIRLEVPPPLPALMRSGAPFAGPASQDIPWDYLLLAATAVASLTGLLCFGLFPLLTGAAAGVYLAVVKQGKPSGVLIACLAMSLVGFLAGVVLSYFFWV